MPRFWRASDLGSVRGFLTFPHVHRAAVRGSDHFDLLSMVAWGDKCVHYDDFIGDATDTFMYLDTNVGSGAFTYPAVANGVLRETTGTGDNEGSLKVGNICWMGDLNVVLQSRVRANIVTGIKVEIGFGDLAARNTAIVNVYDTPSMQTDQADVLVAVVDTDGTNGNRWQLVTDGSTTNMNATATQSGEAFGAAATALTTAVADTYDVITLTGIGNRGRMYRNGKSLAHHGSATANQFEGGTAMAPYLTALTRNTTSKLIDFDYIIVAQDRV